MENRVRCWHEKKKTKSSPNNGIVSESWATSSESKKKSEKWKVERRKGIIVVKWNISFHLFLLLLHFFLSFFTFFLSMVVWLCDKYLVIAAADVAAAGCPLFLHLNNEDVTFDANKIVHRRLSIVLCVEKRGQRKKFSVETVKNLSRVPCEWALRLNR